MSRVQPVSASVHVNRAINRGIYDEHYINFYRICRTVVA